MHPADPQQKPPLGYRVGLGVAAADTTMAMIAYFCYSMLQAQIDQYNQLLRVIAGIFVVIVASISSFKTRYRRSAATGPAKAATCGATTCRCC